MQEQLFVAPAVSDTSDEQTASMPQSKDERPALVSVPSKLAWELDEETKAIGRRGLASAREALRKALAEAENEEDLAPAA